MFKLGLNRFVLFSSKRCMLRKGAMPKATPVRLAGVSQMLRGNCSDSSHICTGVQHWRSLWLLDHCLIDSVFRQHSVFYGLSSDCAFCLWVCEPSVVFPCWHGLFPNGNICNSFTNITDVHLRSKTVRQQLWKEDHSACLVHLCPPPTQRI